jgi:membrane-anchored protein YejM (alkaline phosphatase superfamily)
MKRAILLLLLSIVTAGTSLWTYKQVLNFTREDDANGVNVLVVSACSLRPDRIGIYNPASKLTPKIDAWAKDAFVFNNAIAERPWQNFTFEGSEMMNRAFLAKHGYAPFRNQKHGYHFIIPPAENTAGDDEWFWGEDTILKYHAALENLKQVLGKKRRRPTYAFTHLKYMHYPYLDTVNLTAADFATLSPKSRELLSKYQTAPELFDAQLPLLAVLTNSFSLLQKKLNVKAPVLSVAGVVSDPERTAKWKSTPGYAADLTLARELYDLKMKHFDNMAADVLNLFGNEELQKSTIVIFTGDHGEAFMEHGVLGHSVNLYDEMLRYPLMIKFPGQDEGFKLDPQVHHTLVAGLVKDLIEGTVSLENFTAEVNKRGAEHVLSRNCQGDIRSVRYRSEWKLIKNIRNNRSELYDLKHDPGEIRNVAAHNSELAWKLEELMTDKQDEFLRTNTRERKSRVCLQAL